MDSPIDWSAWKPGMRATLVFVIEGGRILLIEKKRGLGAGKINGPGGKIEPGESDLECAIREVQEELMVTPHAPRKLGELRFVMSDCPDILCHVYRSDGCTGTATETDEAVPRWTALEDIPYQLMWEDDRHWLPLLIEEKPFLGRFVFEGERMLWKDLATDVVW